MNLPNGPFSVGSSVTVTGQITDGKGNGIPAAQFATLTLTIVDTLTQSVVNGVLKTNILNTGRGVIDNQGNLTITLLPADTSTDEAPGVPRIQRSLIVDWEYAAGVVSSFGRQQANLVLVALAGP